MKREKSLVFHVVGAVNTYNGASLQAINLAGVLSSFCQSCLVSSSDVNWLKLSSHNSIPHLQLPRSGITRYLSILLVFYRYRPRIVHIHGFWIGNDLLLLAWLCRIKTVLKTTLMGVDDLKTIHEASRIKGWIARRCSVCNSLLEPIAIINRHYLNPERIVCIPNVVAIPKHAIALSEKQNLCLIIGSVIKRKAVDKAISLFLNKIAINAHDHLVIAGDTSADPLYYQQCLTLIPENRRSQVTFIGQVPQKNLESYLMRTKAIIQLSEQEGLPNAVLEAMAYNCVPLISPLEGIAKAIIPNDNIGIIINEKSELNWAKFDKLINSGDIFMRVQNINSAQHITKRYAKLYKKLGMDIQNNER